LIKPINIWLKIMALALFFFSCDLEIPEESYNNPLDIEFNSENGISPPALVFSPSELTVDVGQSVSVNIFVLEVDSIAGTYIQVIYDQSLLSLNTVVLGEILKSNQTPIFFYNDDSDQGTIDIYSSFLGNEVATSGTGSLAHLTFTTLSPGTSTLRFGNTSEIVDRNDNQITLNGIGTGVVVAQ